MNGGPDLTVHDLLAIAIAEPAPGELAAQVRGELDMYSAPELDDVAELRFLGSSGLAVLVGLHYQMATAVRSDMLRLVGLRPTPDADRSARTVRRHDDVEGALAAWTCRHAVGGRLRPHRVARPIRDACHPGLLPVHLWRSGWFSPFLRHRRGNARSAAAGSPGICRLCVKNSSGNATSVMYSLLI
jgi:hypothetical protein